MKKIELQKKKVYGYGYKVHSGDSDEVTTIMQVDKREGKGGW